MSDNLIDQAMMLAGIDAVDGYREAASTYQGYPIAIVSRDLALHATRSRYLMLDGDSEHVLSRAATSGDVLVSESFFRQFDIGRGDHVSLDTPTGPITFHVAGVFYDYAMMRGAGPASSFLWFRTSR